MGWKTGSLGFFAAPGSCLVPGAKSHSLGAILCGVPSGSGDGSMGQAVAALQAEWFFCSQV